MVLVLTNLTERILLDMYILRPSTFAFFIDLLMFFPFTFTTESLRKVVITSRSNEIGISLVFKSLIGCQRELSSTLNTFLFSARCLGPSPKSKLIFNGGRDMHFCNNPSFCSFFP